MLKSAGGTSGGGGGAVDSVNGQTGTVTLTAANVSAGPNDATYIVQTASSGLANEQAMGDLATGIVKNTIATGVQSIAVLGTDYGNVVGQASSVDSEVAIFSGTGGKTIKRAAGTGVAHLTSGVLSASQVMDSEASLSVKPAVTVVATTNQALTGTPTIDSVATAAGSLILLTAQTAPAENGPWVAAAGAWARPGWYPAGGTTQAFQFITTLVRLGTVYGGSTWRITSAGAVTIDTTSTTWQVTPFSLNSTTATGLPAGANPSASVGLAAVNGAAATFMRSDGAPALDVSIAPTWTGIHIWSLAEPRLKLSESDQGADLKLWDIDLNGGLFAIRTRTDADGAGRNFISASRTSTIAIATITFGDAAGSTAFAFAGSGTVTATGPMAAPRFNPTSATVPTNGMYLPGTNRLGFATNSAAAGEFDASGNFITKKATADQSYSLQAPTTGFSITIANNISTLILKPAGTLATGTITMPATPVDGQNVRFTTSQIITALTVSPNSGQSIIAAPTTLAVGAGAAFIYSLSDTTWYRLY